ncbi:tRNA lysidine(34) synthetase TilS [Mycoplasma sp. 480]|uniref:tRNA lysidine(34) synthetase TilS n=1 Tax=Mycoplasma sp. 480 TaxID=3440155 RepID=UPI003F518FF6
MLKIKKQRLLLAVSGGPDSIFMLNKFKNKDIVVAHVNYKKRETSDEDQTIVENFCKKYKIPFFVLTVSYDNYEKIENFQNFARQIRYDFFKKIYKENNCNFLYIAHNKDDFFETIMLQKNKNKIVNYWGIKKKSQLFDMQIYRPLLFKYSKNKIEKILKNKNINFAIDYTNNLPIYERNKIRIEFKNKSFYKNLTIFSYKIKNIFLLFKDRKNKKMLQKWEKTNFDIDWLKQQTEKKQKNLIYNLIHQKFLNINLTENKINLILQFLFSQNRTSSFLLKKGIFLYKVKNHIIFNE